MAHTSHGDMFARRVCLGLDGMEAVNVRHNIPYTRSGDEQRLMDVYYPRAPDGGGPWPAVLIVTGYPATANPRPTPLDYKDFGWTVSMAQLIARSGMMAVAYTCREPVADLERLLEHLGEHSGALALDATRLGVLAVSGNVPTALATLQREWRRPPVCAVFGYGCLLDLDGATDVAAAARQYGFANPVAGRSVGDLRRDVPLLVTRAGQDQFPAMNASIDRFVVHALRENLPMTLVNYSQGVHAYDLVDESLASRSLVRQTLAFLSQHLTNPNDDSSQRVV